MAGPLGRNLGALTATAILLFALGVAISGGLGTLASIRGSFQEQTRIADGQLALERMLTMQLDEENYLRGYVITRDPAYLTSFRATSAQFEKMEAHLRQILAMERSPEAAGMLLDYDNAHHDWHELAANPILHSHGSNARTLDKRGRFLIDQERQEASAIEQRLAMRNAQVLQTTQEQINRTLSIRLVWLVVFGLLAILFNVYRSRLNRHLEFERLTTHTLQQAFTSVAVPLPNCDVGSGYRSADSRLAVGGDVFDIYRLSDRLAMLLIADVSGKGVDAAVLTAFIKFTIRGIAIRRRDPAFILSDFNTTFRRTVEDPYIFVTMFVGLLDTVDMVLDYASGGHDSAFVRRAHSVEQLAVTGPIVGVMEEPFETRKIALSPADTLVLATDGLTEARDARGSFLNAEGAMELIGRGPADPQALCDALIADVRKRQGNRMRDDLAVLAVRVKP
ncbi:MAG: SpoIIE family protein phosphatase [Candidatus Eremiobacteraeota bacterium]|nr:SpoIIE family protein phosphatase [Candidatus Eremiobacteraeota bacterium]